MRHFPILIRLIILALVAGALVACGGGGGGTAAACSNASSNSTPAYSTYISNQSNAVELTVDNGPPCSGYNVNRLYTSVTVCQSGNASLCQTIDHVLVDTGSTGLRLLHSVLNPALNLGTVTAASGRPLLNCIQFVDNSHAFGRVATADVTLGPKIAANLPIQIIADPAYTALSSNCASGTGNNTPATLGANGILGVGMTAQDCGIDCTTISSNNYYFTCTTGTCSAAVGTTATLAKQITNPVSRFATDNNGVVIDLPAVPSQGATSIAGQMLFGIGTASNNTPIAGVVSLTTATDGYITTAPVGAPTVLSNASMGNSFIDTGSNGVYFDATLPLCSSATDFYCPASNTTVPTTLSGTNMSSTSVSFVAGNAQSLFNTSRSVLPTLTGPMGDSTTFDWGLPFFYGRRVFIGMENTTTSLGTGPLYAF